MTINERSPTFLPFWAVRILWLLGIAALWGWIEAAETPLYLSLGLTGALALQLLLLLLWFFKRLPTWHSGASVLAAGLLAILTLWIFPDTLHIVTLLGLIPLWDLSRWHGQNGALFLLLFPLAPFVYLYLTDTLPGDILPFLAASITVGALGSLLAATPTRERESLPQVSGEEDAAERILTRVAHLLVRETRYDKILAVLMRGGCDLLEGGTHRGRAKAMALTFKPGLRDILTVVAQHNMDQVYADQEYELEGVLGLMMEEGDPLDTSAETPPFDKMRRLAGHRVLLFPLRTGLDLFGVVMFATEDEARAAQHNVQRTLIALADQASLALHNAALHNQLTQDRDERLNGAGDARHQLARDLHDGPVQRVAAIAMQLEFIKNVMQRKPEQALAEIEQLQETAKLASKEMRTMLFTLRPVVLESEGLAAAVEAFINRLREQDRLDIRFEAENLPRLDERVEEIGFAILQEAINNAKKYAATAPIHVRLARGREMVVGQVKDQGPGFDLREVTASYGTRASLGLLNMRERAEMVGGVLQIDTAPGAGTTISVALPHELN